MVLFILIIDQGRDHSAWSCNSEEPLKLYLEEVAMEHHRLALQEDVIHIDQWRGHFAGSKVAASVLWFSTVHNTQLKPCLFPIRHPLHHVFPSSTSSHMICRLEILAVANGSHVCFQYNSSTNLEESLKLYLDFGEAFSGTS
ncbi:uncharacterized protein LOC107417938 isoform X3 [Ziziphus jujuba]|uniref:Uncharacterized protein LOC107417938 isoform X3 n=1 Tax=Ziziphus jujuba TaxID=326968 RepID=A0ABM4A363_ZIZJJ|nr:uncharacterized protein LOC107417938 isoform X3 [Ziziphus jujuba]